MSLALATDARGADLHGLGNLLFWCSFSRGLKTTNVLLTIRETFKQEDLHLLVQIAIMCRTKWHWAPINNRVLGVDIVLLLYATLWHRSDRISRTATPEGAKQSYHIDNDSSALQQVMNSAAHRLQIKIISNLGARGDRLLSRLLRLLGLLSSPEWSDQE